MLGVKQSCKLAHRMLGNSTEDIKGTPVVKLVTWLCSNLPRLRGGNHLPEGQAD